MTGKTMTREEAQPIDPAQSVIGNRNTVARRWFEIRPVHGSHVSESVLAKAERFSKAKALLIQISRIQGYPLNGLAIVAVDLVHIGAEQ